MLKRLLRFFWLLVPANPILVRVVSGASKRSRHLWLRFAYLAVLLLVTLAGLTMNVQGARGHTLADLAKGASVTFSFASMTQLALMCFLAPIFTAGAITQERDAQTYNILLSTPLSNAQIVLGSLMSRLYFVLMLLLAGLPIFLITMVYGGVTGRQIVESLSLAGATAILTGSLAIAISMVRVGNKRTIFSFYTMIGAYLLAVYLLGLSSRTWIAAAPEGLAGRKLSWLAAFHPFLSLEVALNRIPAPEPALVASAGWFWSEVYSRPQAVYVAMTLGLSCVLVVLSMFFVRRGSKEGEITPWSGVLSRLTRRPASGRVRSSRHVWQNPVAWREAVTRASGISGGVMRGLLILGGFAAAAILLFEYARSDGGMTAAMARRWLAGMVIVEFGLVLVAAVNVAASAITKEKESNTMDLLLTTPLTSQYIVFGKLRGVVSYAVPLIAVPVLSVLAFAVYDLLARRSPAVAHLESAVLIAALMVAFAAWACMLGLQVSLRSQSTVRAVMVAIGTLVALMMVVTAIVWKIAVELGAAGAFVATFAPFSALAVICDPLVLFATEGEARMLAQMNTVRVLCVAGTAAAVLVYALIVASMYKSMVRNFDMTLRKQTASR